MSGQAGMGSANPAQAAIDPSVTQQTGIDAAVPQQTGIESAVPQQPGLDPTVADTGYQVPDQMEAVNDNTGTGEKTLAATEAGASGIDAGAAGWTSTDASDQSFCGGCSWDSCRDCSCCAPGNAGFWDWCAAWGCAGLCCGLCGTSS